MAMADEHNEAEARTLADFEGRWQMVRRIVHADGTVARMEGEACWTPAPDGLICEERGLLQVADAAPLEAQRRYLWSDGLRVWFDDGRFFHQVPARGGTCSHWCDPDQYEGRYVFGQWPSWRCIWQVRGPRKDYIMMTEYRPEHGTGRGKEGALPPSP
ncbi:DUF6314 family protein [Roseovarius gahaiensis]|nr:DUF6314 family protein [Roseovarius gahaiensis]